MTLDKRMITLSVHLIQSRRRTIDEVPEHLRDAVQAQINADQQPEAVV
ncbi:CD1375 family protein [Paenibacillus sp. FSL A5-0031]|nr:CD1375 family protein [Paenibacillus sp. FSL A5-0031]